MKIKSQMIYIFLLILFTGFMVTPAMGYDRSEDAIALWVADQIELTQSFDMPTIHYVDKDTLGSVFREGTQKSYSSWQQEYGEDEAKKILEGYIEEIVGLFNDKSQIIYVADFIDSCSQEAVFAHEMVHYFQHLMEGVIPVDSYYEDEKRFLREMRAYNIENKYHVAFCDADKGATPDPEDNAMES